MIERGLAGVVGFAAFLRNYGIRRAGENHGARETLIAKDWLRSACQQIVASNVDEKRFGPLGFGEITFRTRQRIDSRRVHDQVESSKFQNGAVNSFCQGLTGAQVHSGGGHESRGRKRASFI